MTTSATIPATRTRTRASSAARQSRTTELFAELVECAGVDEERATLLRERLVVTNLEVAHGVARRYRGRGVALDDLEQVAALALVKAVGRFDPASGHDFLSFAVPTISGEIKRWFRDQSWTVRPPRRVQEVQLRVLDAVDEYDDESPATLRAVASKLDLPVTLVQEALAARGCWQATSLDAPTPGTEGGSLVDRLVHDDDGTWSGLEARVLLADLLAGCTERERTILRLRFVEEKTQAEIGEVLGVTQMQVSRLLKQILGRLRETASQQVPAAAA